MSREEIKKIKDSSDSKWFLIVYDAGWGNQSLYANRHDIELDDDYLSYVFDEIEYEAIETFMPITKLTTHTPTLGSDPEFFFTKRGKVVPSKFIIGHGTDNVATDGFQGELHPHPDTCRQVSGDDIGEALCDAYDMAELKGASISLDVGVVIEKPIFYAQPAEERRFGCNPTLNSHESSKKLVGTRTRFRSGSGHIHLGSEAIKRYMSNVPAEVVSLLDIVCGNTCVLIDRDPLNARRRKYYGRAGEHRIKSYGLEYRVPSNFWLKSYVLWSMVSGLARNAINLVGTQVGKEILETISMQTVRRAINTNDKELALKVFHQYATILRKHNVVFDGGIDVQNVEKFIRWASLDNPMEKLNIGSIHDIVEEWREKETEDTPGFEVTLNEMNL